MPRAFGFCGLTICLLSWGGMAAAQGPGSENAPPPTAPPVPQGVEVLARGPVHEAFATPTTAPTPTQLVPKAPPKPLEEMPPDQKPEGNVVWIGGYWAWDDDRHDFLWVSGVWRSAPPGKTWVAGYWREADGKWQWVPGFWTEALHEGEPTQQLTYYPSPPPPPETAAPGEPPTPDSFYIPGVWYWAGDHYAWRAGYWGRVQPGYVWVAAHYRWTPSGYVFIPGYWDLTVARRGVLYAPVVVDPNVVGVTFVYTPYYAVQDTFLVDALWVRPSYGCYYFGDYYGPAYHDLGFESYVVYSRRCYDPIFVYERWDHRRDPNWVSVQVNLYNARYRGEAPLPPRTLVQQTTIVNINRTTTINNTRVIMPASQLAAAQGQRLVPVDRAQQWQIRQQAQAVQQVALQRSQMEVAAPGGVPQRPRAATLQVPPNLPRGNPVNSSFAASGANRPGMNPARPAYRPPYRPAPGPSRPAPSRPDPRERDKDRDHH